MSTNTELLRQGKTEEIWQKCCGFLDLSIAEFMDVQKRLLLEQIEMLKQCELGRRVLNGAEPASVEEFVEQVPMTTYVDYCPELVEKREDILPVKPKLWMQTSGRSGEYKCKWIPVTERYWEEAGQVFSALAIFGACKEKGDIPYKKGFKLLHAAAQKPYLTGTGAYKLEEELGFDFLPPLRESEKVSFEERIDKGFKLAMSEGMDGFYGLAGVLVAVGEKFKQGTSSTKYSQLIMEPKKLSRLLRGKIKSKIAGRPMLPKDLWDLKVIASMGTDCTVYKNKIKELWGRTPLEVYGNTETSVIAAQTWDYDGMVFFPNLNFLEFIPEEEHFKSRMDKSYQPRTVLLDQVKAGEVYELVITNFHGGALVRYKIGDMVRITSLRNEKLGIDIPQMVFERRADDLIDLGFMRLTERVIWKAIENTGIPYRDWLAHKELGEVSRLHLYIELMDNYSFTAEEVASAVYDEILKVDDGLYVYKDLPMLAKLIGFTPVDVTLLKTGSFASYKSQRQSEGADLAHLKPPHMNPPIKVLASLGIRQDSVPDAGTPVGV
jgi:hypothetical protein